MMDNKNFDSLSGLEKLKIEIQVKAKNGIDFILAATIIWFGIFLIWKFSNYTLYNKSMFTFILVSLLTPSALLLSKVFKTNWKIKDNALQPLGLWLNFAQLIYFPFLFFILIKYPNYFLMTYAIITGAHLFPFTWFYNEIGYAVASVIISVGSMIIALAVQPDNFFYIPIFTALALLILGIKISMRNKKMQKEWNSDVM
jgi:hypothetical protein